MVEELVSTKILVVASVVLAGVLASFIYGLLLTRPPAHLEVLVATRWVHDNRLCISITLTNPGNEMVFIENITVHNTSSMREYEIVYGGEHVPQTVEPKRSYTFIIIVESRNSFRNNEEYLVRITYRTPRSQRELVEEEIAKT